MVQFRINHKDTFGIHTIKGLFNLDFLFVQTSERELYKLHINLIHHVNLTLSSYKSHTIFIWTLYNLHVNLIQTIEERILWAFFMDRRVHSKYSDDIRWISTVQTMHKVYASFISMSHQFHLSVLPTMFMCNCYMWGCY
jgi:hypothetical protein